MPRKVWLGLFFSLQLTASLALAEDWPTYRHDNRRSGVAVEGLAAARLELQWVWNAGHWPQPAWAGPARWDAYADIRGLRSMRNYDPVFHVIAAKGAVWFGSSVDDSVHCLDAATGQERWVFTTDGPVRIAPTLDRGRVYFGSDDGFAYCLQADSGKLIWRHGPGSRERLILNDGRLIPLWPCRTGVLIDGDTAYFAAGLLPWKPSYLCAVDAQTGQATGPGRYIHELSGATIEGALLASPKRLFALQGRVAPQVFDRVTGRSEGSLKKGGGGSFALLTEDARILHGPGNKTGWITESDSETRDQVASFPGGNTLLVAGDRAYLASDRSLTALNRTTGTKLWSKPYELPCDLILAGDTLFAGGNDGVAAIDTRSGDIVWRREICGRAYGLAVAGGALLVSTDEGQVYCFRPDAKPASTASLPSTEKATATPIPRDGKAAVALGPWLEFTGATSAVVRWETAAPTPTKLRYGTESWSRTIESPALQMHHEVHLTGLRKDTLHHYAIEAAPGGQAGWTPAFECDTCCNYSLPAIPERLNPAPGDDAAVRSAETAKGLLAAGGRERGVGLVLGCGDGRLLYDLARHSRLRVIGFDVDPSQVTAARQTLRGAGLYGTRTSVQQGADLNNLPVAERLANLVFVHHGATWQSAWRLVQPGGVVLLRVSGTEPNGALDGVRAAGAPAPTLVSIGGESWIRLARPAAEKAGVWSHQYGLPDNSGYGGESLGQTAGCSELDVQWLGQPGPRAQPDRNGRKPAPLAIAGRLFTQGLHRIIAQDAYNGTILWSLETPHLERFNMPRDTGNWCADEASVYAAVRGQCWRIDAATGVVAQRYGVVPGAREKWSWDWGYVARPLGNQLLGSAVRSGTSWTSFWGGAGAGWYDLRHGEVTQPICSDNLFSLAVDSGRAQWTYGRGLILNPTLTIGDGRVYFAECRQPQILAADARRTGQPELWRELFLVAVDLASGQVIWERPLETPRNPVVFYLAYGEGKLVLVASDTQYHVSGFAAQTGVPAWNATFPWPERDGKPVDNHGRHMSRPAIFGGRVFVRPRMLNLADGKLLEASIPDGGCGTYALTDRMLIFRSGNVTLWDFAGGYASAWPRLRPDCWLSTIPACGMLLSPEAGGGCSCGSWMETSLGFAPVHRPSK